MTPPSLTQRAASCRRLKRGIFHHAQVVIVERARSARLIDAAPVPPWTRPGWKRGTSANIQAKRRGDGKGSGHRQRAWPKLTAVLHTHSHLIIGAVTGIGPSQDSPDFTPALRQAAAIMALDTVLADAGYDTEHNHCLCQDELGIKRSIIALNRRNTGRRWPKTPHRQLSGNASLAPSIISAGTLRAGSVNISAASAQR
ncbi:transposase [Teichococcus vastitatis]|uniref:Transposase n=1 Tax=Teichococcus vastitatis TaxID=2307076 RepID=A0ABS9W8C9_9PROT|nr:transposase [Pseudoroseomonas vastitatis]MCI0754869.1 transposase [Pseudoroseomonas vastitatis]